MNYLVTADPRVRDPAEPGSNPSDVLRLVLRRAAGYRRGACLGLAGSVLLCDSSRTCFLAPLHKIRLNSRRFNIVAAVAGSELYSGAGEQRGSIRCGPAYE